MTAPVWVWQYRRGRCSGKSAECWYDSTDAGIGIWAWHYLMVDTSVGGGGAGVCV